MAIFKRKGTGRVPLKASESVFNWHEQLRNTLFIVKRLYQRLPEQPSFGIVHGPQIPVK